MKFLQKQGKILVFIKLKSIVSNFCQMKKGNEAFTDLIEQLYVKFEDEITGKRKLPSLKTKLGKPNNNNKKKHHNSKKNNCNK